MTTKIPDNMRDTTAVDGAKITTGTIPEARIPTLAASKLTGTIANARIPASAVTQHVVATDTTKIENDISILALHNAVNSNMSAHNLSNNFIEQFEDSNSITTTSAVRSSDEYVSAGSLTPTLWPYTNYADQVFSAVGGSFTDVAYWNGQGTTHTVAKNKTSTYLAYAASPSGFTHAVQFDYLTPYTWTGLYTGFWNTYGMIKTWRLEKSDNGTDWTIVDQTGTTSSAASAGGYTLTNDNNFAVTQDSTGLITNTTNGGNFTSHGGKLTFGTAVTARHLRVIIGSFESNSNSNCGFDFFQPIYNLSAVTATGSYTSTTITPQDASSKSSVGLVLLYKNNAGTNTLNTDIIAKVSANNGTTYSTCVLAAQGTFSTGINIAVAPAIAVTAGAQLKYKVEFANQASGSKEARIHGVALQY